MLRSYVKIAFRSLSKNRLTTFINVFGLGLSMSVGLMILIRFQDALSYDKFHPSPERTYRITSAYNKKSGEKWLMASTPLPLQNALSADTNTIEQAVNVYPALNGKATAEGKEININAAFTEPSFFSVFGFSLLTGDAATALKQPNSIVINRSTAEKFFGNDDVIGKVISMENGTGFIITGVLNDFPGKSHLYYDAYASYNTVIQMENDKKLVSKSSDWFGFNMAYTYVLMKKNVQVATLQAQLNSIAGNLNRYNKDGTASFGIQPLNKITPGDKFLANDIGGGTSWSKIYFEGGIALLILLAACFNYTNLTIARALTRAKEVGIRKIAGAKRLQIFVQYIFESVLLSLLALGFAWIILTLIVRYAPFNDDYEFIPSSFQYNISFVSWSVIYALFTGLLAGSSPAWILSAFKPLRVLKNLSTARILGKVSLQKTLIVFQYSLSLVVIIFLFAFYKQFSFMAKGDPGFKKENIMIVPLNGMDEAIAKQTLQNLTGVKSVAATTAKFTKHFSGINMSVWMNNKQDAIGLNYYYADGHFIPSMKFSFIAGNNFPSTAENNNEQFIVLNEQAVHALGYKDVFKAVGEKLWLNDSTQLKITGVLKDFNYEATGIPVRPLAFRTKNDACNYLYIETQTADKTSMNARVVNALQGLHPNQPVAVSWLDDTLDASNSQTATISLLGFLAFIALAIATLGLLGLVVYTVEVKHKEISIRKIIGAGEFQLINFLSKGFIKLLLITGLIAIPIGWMLAVLFLQNFSERTEFTLVNVAMCFLFLLGIGLFTIVSQTYKAAVANPVESLRTE